MSTLDAADEPALILAVAGNTYAIPLGDVIEVTRAVAVTTPSGDAGPTTGYIDLRGQLVPVVSGRAALGLSTRDLQLNDRFVVVRASGRLAALQVDGVSGVESIASDVDPTAGLRPGLAVTRRATDAEVSAVVIRLDVRALIPDLVATRTPGS